MLLPLYTLAACLGFGGALLGCVYLIASSFSVLRFASRPILMSPHKAPVTILKPLCGDDHELMLNLRSFCRQDYPVYQIVFGIQNPDDKALPVVRALVKEFPHIDISIVVDSARLSHNMKVANLQNMLSAAKYDYLVMADSDMRVRPDYLTDVTAPLADPAVGAVTCLYRGVSQGGLWSDMGCLQINYGFLPQAILGDSLNIGNGCFGATIAMRRDTLVKLGGFNAIGNVLADDHELGLSIRRLGLRVALSPHVIDNIISEPDLPTLFKHETRWARTIHMVHQGGYIGSVLTHPIALAVSGAACSPWPQSAALILGVAIALRLITGLIISRALNLPSRFLWLLPLRDMLSFAVFLNGFVYRTVKWRSHTFRVSRNGQIILDGDLAA